MMSHHLRWSLTIPSTATSVRYGQTEVWLAPPRTRVLESGLHSFSFYQGLPRPTEFLIYDKIGFLFFVFFGCGACGILVPQPGIKPGPSAVKAQSPNHWTTREFPKIVNCNPLSPRNDLHLLKDLVKSLCCLSKKNVSFLHLLPCFKKTHPQLIGPS